MPNVTSVPPTHQSSFSALSCPSTFPHPLFLFQPWEKEEHRRLVARLSPPPLHCLKWLFHLASCVVYPCLVGPPRWVVALPAGFETQHLWNTKEIRQQGNERIVLKLFYNITPRSHYGENVGRVKESSSNFRVSPINWKNWIYSDW